MNVSGLIKQLTYFLSPVSPNISSACNSQSQQYINGLKQGLPWAVKMWDASGKYQAGVIEGNVNSLGLFAACINKMPNALLTPRHCVAVIGLEKKPLETMMEELLGTKGVFWGFCLPSSCSSSDLKISLNEWLSDWNFSVRDVTCQDTFSQPWEVIDWLAIVVLIVLVLLTLLSTAYDAFRVYRQRDNPNFETYVYTRNEEFLVSFSVINNGHSLVMDASPDDVVSVYGLRFLSICWIVLSNTFNTLITLPAVNQLYVRELMQKWTFMPDTRFSLAVESFFLMSGVLTANKFLKSITPDTRPKRMGGQIVLLFFHRYFRLIPTVALLILLQLSLWKHCGSGPLWLNRTKPITEACKESWYWTLLFIENYVVGDRMCLKHTWYLNVDLQLFFLSPLVIVPLLYWKEWVCLSMFTCLIFGGFIISFLINYLNEFPAGITVGDEEKLIAKEQDYQIKTHTRFTSYIIGIAVSYLLHKYKTKVQESSIKLRMQILLWFATLVGINFGIFGLLLFQSTGYTYEPVTASLFTSAMPIFWALGVGWIVFCCETKQCALVSHILEYKKIQPVGRLVYCIYFGNLPLLDLRASTVRVPVFISFPRLVLDFLGGMVLILLFATLLYLVVERPFVHLFYFTSRWICERIYGSEEVQQTMSPVVYSTVLVPNPNRVIPEEGNSSESNLNLANSEVKSKASNEAESTVINETKTSVNNEAESTVINESKTSVNNEPEKLPSSNVSNTI